MSRLFFEFKAENQSGLFACYDAGPRTQGVLTAGLHTFASGKNERYDDADYNPGGADADTDARKALWGAICEAAGQLASRCTMFDSATSRRIDPAQSLAPNS
jgi:hypothetical protein